MSFQSQIMLDLDSPSVELAVANVLHKDNNLQVSDKRQLKPEQYRQSLKHKNFPKYRIEIICKRLKLRGHSSGITSVCFSPDGRYIATGSEDNTAIIWDADSGEQVRKLERHSDCSKTTTTGYRGL